MHGLNIHSIDLEPLVTLTGWSIFEVTLPSQRVPTMHSCRYRPETRSGKVSSPISALEPVSRCCMKRSGNICMLEGSRGASPERRATRGQWVWMNKIQRVQDVTQDFVAYFAGADGS